MCSHTNACCTRCGVYTISLVLLPSAFTVQEHAHDARSLDTGLDVGATVGISEGKVVANGAHTSTCLETLIRQRSPCTKGSLVAHFAGKYCIIVNAKASNGGKVWLIICKHQKSVSTSMMITCCILSRILSHWMSVRPGYGNHRPPCQGRQCRSGRHHRLCPVLWQAVG